MFNIVKTLTVKPIQTRSAFNCKANSKTNRSTNKTISTNYHLVAVIKQKYENTTNSSVCEEL